MPDFRTIEVTAATKEAASDALRERIAVLIKDYPADGPGAKAAQLLANAHLNMLPPFIAPVEIKLRLKVACQTAPIGVQRLHNGPYEDDRVYLGASCQCDVSVKAVGDETPYRDRIDALKPAAPETKTERIARLRAEAAALEAEEAKE